MYWYFDDVLMREKRKKVTRKEALKLVKESMDEAKKLHKSLRDGTFKATSKVDIIK